MLRKIRGTIIMLGECVRMSVSNIFGNRARSLLTVLGILIGVTAVIALITTVSGFSGSLSSSFSALGAGSLTVTVTGSDLKSGLSAEDMNSLAELEAITGVSPSVTVRNAVVSRNGVYEENVNVTGKNDYYFRVTDDALKRGRSFNYLDERDMTFVCMISQDLTKKLCFGEDPIEQTLYINGYPFVIVGTINEDSTTSIATMIAGGDDIMIPYTTAMKLNNTNIISSFTAFINSEAGYDTEKATDALETALDEMFDFEEDCYSILDMSSVEDTLNNMLTMVSTLLAGIASIALIVGGIGIMNMMLTTVTERTTEIGLKKALGAMPWQIQAQFLIESFLLSVFGGIMGIVFGLGISYGLCKVIGMEFVLSPGAIILGFGFSAAVGIVFGWAPSRKASRLNPIDALRSM